MLLDFLFIAMFLLVACESKAEPENLEYSVARTNTFLQLAGQPDEILVENCGGERDSKQTITRSRSFLTALEIEVSNQVAAEFGGDAKLAEATLRAQIGTSLSVRFGAELENSSALEIITPPDTKTITTIQWKERWTTGDITIIRPDGSYLDVLPFLALNSLVLEQQGVKTIRCDGDDEEVITEQSTPEILPTLPPLILPTPTPIVLGTVTVPGNSNEGYLFEAQASGRYVFRYISGAYSVYPLNVVPQGVDPWLADIRVFKNRPVAWNDEDISESSDFRLVNVGYNSSAEGAEEMATRFSTPVTISLAQGDALRLVGVDKKSSYNDNPGEVTFEVLFYPQQ